MIKEKLESLNLPSPLCINGEKVKTVEEWEKVRPLVLKAMLESEYGYIPEKPEKIGFRIIKEDKVRYCAGKAVYIELEIVCTLNGEEFTFPVTYVYPKNREKIKTFVHINFRPNVPDEYMPTEEIADNGFGCASFCYENVTSDDADFTNGLAGVVYKNAGRTPYSCGKIAMWAWAGFSSDP